MLHRWKFVLALAAVAAFLSVRAEERTLTLDPTASKVTFSLGGTTHDVHGTLHLKGGEIRFDPETGAAAGEISIDASRAESGNEKRDKTMHRKVLETETHPFILFEAERLNGTVAESGASHFELVGTISIVGSEHPVVLPVNAQIDGNRVTASSTISIPYVE